MQIRIPLLFNHPMYPLLVIYGHVKQQVLLWLVVMAIPAFALFSFDKSRLQNDKNIFIQAGTGRYVTVVTDSADSLKGALRKASLVIRGKVIKTNISDETFRKTISEHDPLFRKAVIEIKEVLKGRSKNKLLFVYYASSDDVQWYQSPKLTAGQESIFLLQLGQSPKVFKSGAYTLLQRVAVQPVQQMSIIRKWLK